MPFETRSPFVTSGVRIGTPAVTTRGMREPEMKVVGDLIARALSRVGDESALRAIGDEVADLCGRFPIYLERSDDRAGLERSSDRSVSERAGM